MTSVPSARQAGAFLANSASEAAEDLAMVWRLRRHRRRVDTDFSGVERALVFVGYPRSGHSLVGALIAAHPEVMLSHELNLLSLHRRGLSKRQLLRLIVARDRDFAAMNRQWEGFDYSISGWSGETRRPRVVGDKKGSGSALVLGRQADALDRLQATLGVPLHVLHVARHPLDNVATLARREGSGLDASLTKYRTRVETVARARAEWPAGQWKDLSYEELVGDVRGGLLDVAGWLGLNASEQYLAACQDAVFPSPRRSRDEVDTSGIEAEVAALILEHPFLAPSDS